MKEWFNSYGLSINIHMIAISSNVEKCIEFGIDEKNIFGFDSSINGRFSVWSVVG